MAQEAQQASLNGLMQRYHMVEQQRQMQRQQAMQMGQTLDPADASLMQNSQHVSGPQAFLQQQRMPTGQMIGTYAPAVVGGLKVLATLKYWLPVFSPCMSEGPMDKDVTMSVALSR